MSMLFDTRCIRTFTGKMINPLDPDPALIDIVDIAHALSHQCRFGGHTKGFYSVAQHSLFVSSAIQEKSQQLAGLLHDATEAYLLDIPSPVKNQITGYRQAEDRLSAIIAAKFGFQYPYHQAVLDADAFALEWEWKYVMDGSHYNTFLPEIQKQLFLEVFRDLTTHLYE